MRVYVAIHWACKLAVSLALLWHTNGGTAAVWLGAQTPHRSAWVQAGVADDTLGTYLYAEWKRPGHSPDATFVWAGLGELKHPRLVRRGNWWRAEIGDLRTRWVRLPHAEHCNALELQAGAHAGAQVGLRYEHG